MDHLAEIEQEDMLKDIGPILRGSSHEKSYLIPIITTLIVLP
jgi:hypothetical protein